VQEKEHKRFDELARELANGRLSRRQALRLIGAALAGSALAAFIPGVARGQEHDGGLVDFGPEGPVDFGSEGPVDFGSEGPVDTDARDRGGAGGDCGNYPICVGDSQCPQGMHCFRPPGGIYGCCVFS
jgi:hypothetical protein